MYKEYESVVGFIWLNDIWKILKINFENGRVIRAAQSSKEENKTFKTGRSNHL